MGRVSWSLRGKIMFFLKLQREDHICQFDIAKLISTENLSSKNFVKSVISREKQSYN